ncbi:hypothetical protein TEA_005250 [Camellia sinensis var. sinensis]|uniref:Uncharacterized protein n=1 Tax=Camellia sinensis var. sinensis TaxID=542762 RepID=A0A4V3WLY9_CAMSN|nr:hypothetical protein TEA_005250 [Camellia sinensis var. sinensis]
MEQPCEATGVSPQTKAIGTYRQPISGSSISHINKGKRKVTRRKGLKYSLLAGRFSGFASRVGHKGAGSSYGSKSGIKAKSSSVHSSPSHISDSICTSSSKETLHEAIATLQVGKTLGIDYKGQESEVVKEFMHMEKHDKVRMAGGPGCHKGAPFFGFRFPLQYLRGEARSDIVCMQVSDLSDGCKCSTLMAASVLLVFLFYLLLNPRKKIMSTTKFEGRLGDYLLWKVKDSFSDERYGFHHSPLAQNRMEMKRLNRKNG